jgi:hypothetical protein
MKTLAIFAFVALVGVGVGFLVILPAGGPQSIAQPYAAGSKPHSSKGSATSTAAHALFPSAAAGAPAGGPSTAVHAYVPNVPLTAVVSTRSANPDGSEASELTHAVAVRRDGARAVLYPTPTRNGWLQTRIIYDPATQTTTYIRDNLGIKTTLPGQPHDPMSVITSGCSALPGTEPMDLLWYKAVQDTHFVDTTGTATFNSWRIPELGCLMARSTNQVRDEDGSYARQVEERVIWLSLGDPPDEYFDVSPELEEVTPSEEWQRYLSAGMVSESADAGLIGPRQGDVAYSFYHGKIDRATAETQMQKILEEAAAGAR